MKKLYFLIIIIILIIIYLLLNKYLIKYENFVEKKYTFGVLICCFNRPEYLEKTLNSLKETKLENVIIYIIDDHSDNIKTINLIKKFNIPNVKIIKERNSTNLGIKKSLEKGFNYLYKKCIFLTNLDSDVILKYNWLEKLHNVYLKGKITYPNSNNLLISGFNCTSTCLHKIFKTYNSFYEKKTIGGINTFFHNSLLQEYKNILLKTKSKNFNWDWDLCKYCNNHNIPILVTNPSVVQHIGFKGLNSKNTRVDIAEDF